MENYNELLKIAESLLIGIKQEISILSNASALLNMYLDDINWILFIKGC